MAALLSSGRGEAVVAFFEFIGGLIGAAESRLRFRSDPMTAMYEIASIDTLNNILELLTEAAAKIMSLESGSGLQ